MKEITVSIIIVSYNTKTYIKGALESINDNLKDLLYEVIIVDNASSDGSAEFIKTHFPWAKVIENEENLGFAKACNQGVRISKGKYILLLNPDTVILKDSIPTMIKFMENNPMAGACGLRLLNPDLTPEPRWLNYNFPPRWFLFPLIRSLIGKRFKKNINRTDSSEEIKEVDWVSGACMLIKREIYNESGGFDESYFMFFEEPDLCWRLKKRGYRVFLLNNVTAIHYGGGSYKENHLSIKAIHYFQNGYFLFRRKNYGRINAFIHLTTDMLDNLLVILIFSIAQLFVKDEEKMLERKKFINGRMETIKCLWRLLKDTLSFAGRRN